MIGNIRVAAPKNTDLISTQKTSSKFQNVVDFCKKKPAHVITAGCVAAAVGLLIFSKNSSSAPLYSGGNSAQDPVPESWEQWRNRLLNEAPKKVSEFQETVDNAQQKMMSFLEKGEAIPLEDAIQIHRMQAEAFSKIANWQEEHGNKAKIMLPHIVTVLTEQCKSLDVLGFLHVEDKFNCDIFNLPFTRDALKADPTTIAMLSQQFEQQFLSNRCPELASGVKNDPLCPKHALAKFSNQSLSEWIKTADLGDIKRQYHKLSIAAHPDKNSGDDDNRVAQQDLNLAYATMKEWSKRTGLTKPEETLSGTEEETSVEQEEALSGTEEEMSAEQEEALSGTEEEMSAEEEETLSGTEEEMSAEEEETEETLLDTKRETAAEQTDNQRKISESSSPTNTSVP